MDIKSSEERSKNMAAIRSRDTRPEIYFRKLLFAQGYRYSLNSNKIMGHPDIYLRKYNTAILFTDVSGTDILIVHMHICQKQEQIFGRKSLKQMLKGIMLSG